ncbi:sulfurtransferase [Muricauda sp. JGD-17]|uniref:Sulfurtransferase n=1 Tax=Flagellimonas ochracea TaxID=2696472 RepID=A0A964T9M5_9FLAO|nr:sulfurtransferase [Allomuricauda ochracea]NAY90782.1 sulfurtransferase [Allomuricauda ochracea]
MNFKNSMWIVLFLSAMVSCKRGKDTTSQEIKTYASVKHLMEVEELLEIHKHEKVVIVDFRKDEEYKKGHIEGAINIWRTDIEDTSYPYGGMMAKKVDIETFFSKLGIKNDAILVVYDNKGSSDAARLWWLLKSYGFESVKLLNGGLSAWRQIGGSTSYEMTKTEPSIFTLPVKDALDAWIGKEELLGMVNSSNNVIILDARTEEEFSGKRRKEGATKAGRIPKSIHVDWARSIDYEGTKKFRTFPELEAIYSELEASRDDTIIVYCHTGVRSAHTTFVLTELLGYEQVRNYDGSWTEWSQFDNLPFEKDSVQF